MTNGTWKDKEGGEHEDRRLRPAAAIRLWNRDYPVTLKNIALLISLIVTVGTGIGWILNRFIFPWPTRSEVAEMVQSNTEAISTVEQEHERTRDEIGELKRSTELTAQAVCAMARKFAPENAPPGCAPIIRQMNQRIQTPSSGNGDSR